MVAICSLIKNPFNFDFWLDYHISIGIDYFFLRVEETPELESILCNYRDKVYVEYHNENFDKTNNIFTLADRQINFVNKCINISKSKSIEWLFHVDTDELIWCKSDNLKKYFDNFDKKFDYAHVSNYEAVYPRDNLENPFLQTNKFYGMNLQDKFLSYINGKSACRIKENSSTNSPHIFNGERFCVPIQSMIILHYESATFELWFGKFHNSDRGIVNEKVKNYQLGWAVCGFTNKSIEFINNNPIEEARKFYNDSKVKPYYETSNLSTLFWTPQLPEKNSNWSR